MILLWTFQTFKNASEASAPTGKLGHSAMMTSMKVPGSGDAVAASQILLVKMKEGMTPEEAYEWANDFAKKHHGPNSGQHPFFDDHIKIMLQAEEHKKEFLEAAKAWDWS